MSFVDLLYAQEMSNPVQSPNKRPIKALSSSTTLPESMQAAGPSLSAEAPAESAVSTAPAPTTTLGQVDQPTSALSAPGTQSLSVPADTASVPASAAGKKRKPSSEVAEPPLAETSVGATATAPPAKKPRTNTPWTPEEEQRLKAMRDAGSSWSEIAKTFPTRTEGSVKKHWYKDMHYAEFAEDESAALLAAIKEYDANKWKVVGQKVGKPAKACEQYAKEHFKL